MADYYTREETTTRRFYILPSPTNWGQVAKVLEAIGLDLNERGLHNFSDDVVKVEAWDDEIRFSFEVKP